MNTNRLLTTKSGMQELLLYLKDDSEFLNLLMEIADCRVFHIDKADGKLMEKLSSYLDRNAYKLEYADYESHFPLNPQDIKVGGTT